MVKRGLSVAGSLVLAVLMAYQGVLRLRPADARALAAGFDWQPSSLGEDDLGTPTQMWPALRPFVPAGTRWLHSDGYDQHGSQIRWRRLYLDPERAVAFFALFDHWSRGSMSAEFTVEFTGPGWLREHRRALEQRITTLATFSERLGDEFRLVGTEPRDERAWSFDVRVFPAFRGRVLVEISGRPPSIERDLRTLAAWFRAHGAGALVDEDGVPTGW